MKTHPIIRRNISVNAEITDIEEFNGWVLYDGQCGMCVAGAERWQGMLARRRLVLLPLQRPWVAAVLGATPAELLVEMRLLRPDGTSCGGADAILEISRHFWWAWPFHTAARIPAVRSALRWGYRQLARRRCTGGVCPMGKQKPPGKTTAFFEMP